MSFGSRLYTSWVSDDPAGLGTCEAHSATTVPLLALVSNIHDGPLVPRASKLTTMRTSFAHRCPSTNARAPSRPSSSPSVKSTMMSLRGAGPVRNARTASSTAATPDAASAAPGAAGTES